MPKTIRAEKIIVDGKTILQVNGQTVVQYESFQEKPSLKFNKDTKIFTFKGIEITLDDACFLCKSIPVILRNVASIDSEGWDKLNGIGSLSKEVLHEKKD